MLIASQDIGMSPFFILDTSFAEMDVFISVKFMSKAGMGVGQGGGIRET